MAIRIDRPRFRNIFGRMTMPRDEAEELVDALEDTFDESRHDMATRQDLINQTSEIRAAMAERETRLMLALLVVVGVLLSAIGVATAVVLSAG